MVGRGPRFESSNGDNLLHYNKVLICKKKRCICITQLVERSKINKIRHLGRGGVSS